MPGAVSSPVPRLLAFCNAGCMHTRVAPRLPPPSQDHLVCCTNKLRGRRLMADHGDLSAQISELQARLQACEAQLGEGPEVSLSKAIGDLTKRVEELYRKEPRLQELLRNVEARHWAGIRHSAWPGIGQALCTEC